MKLIDTSTWKSDHRGGGRKVRELREQRGVTQDELAEASGVAKTLISRLEWGGTKKLSLEQMTRLYGALGLSPNRAAQDYIPNFSVAEPLLDPRMDEVRALIRSLEGEERSDLIDDLLMCAQLFMRRREKESA